MTKLSERAMLASLRISTYTGYMTDREVTEEVNETYKADKKAGSYNKRLINSTFLKGVSSAHNNAKRVHKLLTLPWEDDGTRILTTAAYITYTSKMKDCRFKVEDEVKNFIQQLPEAITEAKTRLGKMFNESDYPTQDEIKSKFGFDVEIKSVPESGDFRAQLSDEQTKHIIKDIERRSKERLDNAMDDVFHRVAEYVGRMRDKLKEYQPAKENGGKREGIIRDSIVYNIHELAEIMPILNVTDDPRIEQLRKQMLDDLVEPASPEILRADVKARKQAIANAERILKKVEGYLK